MTDPKGLPGGDDVDWAGALDEWEEKAFGSVHPPALAPAADAVDAAAPQAGAPEIPRAPDLPIAAQADAAAPLEDSTLASAEHAEGIAPHPSTEAHVSVVEPTESDVELIDADEPTPPPPRRPRTAPPAVTSRIIPPPRSSTVRIEEAPRSADAPRLSVVTGALQALTAMRAQGDDDARPSRIPMPSAKPVGSDIAAVLAEQADWLEAEAATADEPERAKVFLALSEIRAVLGDPGLARVLAARARDLAPGSVLAHHQARSLDTVADDVGGAAAEASLLLAEEAAATTPAAKRHAAMLAVDALRLAGDIEGALLKVSRTAETGDLRAVVGRATFGLAQSDVEGLAAFVALPEARRVRDGLTTTLRLRGATAGDDRPADTPEGVTDALRKARDQLAAGDRRAAADSLAALRAVPELAGGAAWLAASLASTTTEGRPLAIAWLGELARDGDLRAARVLAARAVETGDGAAAAAAIGHGGFSAADHIALAALLGLGATPPLDDLASELSPFAAAVAATALPSTQEAALVDRASRVVGPEGAMAATRVARLLATGASKPLLGAAIDPLRPSAPEAGRALDLELALRDGNDSSISDIIRGWTVPTPQGRPSDAALVAGLVAERAADAQRALSAYREARAKGAGELALRAIAALHPSTDLPGELNELADEQGATVQGALARLEAVLREDSVDDATRSDLLERAHAAAPSLPFAAYLAERIALRSNDADEVLRWIGERARAGADPVELIVDGVREGRILSERDPAATAARIADAHRLRPADLGLRLQYERTLPGPAEDAATYWEAQASSVVGPSRALLCLSIAHAYERAGDMASVHRVASVSEGPTLLRQPAQRAALEGGEAAHLVEQLLEEAKTTEDGTLRQEAYERLAEIDGVGRGDTASALMWHQTILEESPQHLPSLRYVEQALIGAGRDDELEPIATCIAHALSRPGATDGGESVAHADLAVRLRARQPDAEWESTAELAELAAADAAPSLSSLRLLQAHARTRKDDRVLISASERLLDRATRPVEMAALRLRVAEAAFRQNDLATALISLEQSTAEDPGDLVAFRLLADVRQASGDPDGAAEAHESVARLSVVPAHQLEAWYDAARLWLESPPHREQAVHALEQAAALDLTHGDVFRLLSGLYAEKKAHTDLAALLERRITLSTDPDERVSLEVDHARALLSAGDRAAARVAVAAALADRPDHTTALATFGDLSALEEDWAAAEDAWVRLARLLSTPEEQRGIYERLGDLYSTKAVHLERAELAWREVLKRAPGDVPTTERLIDVYRRQRDVGRAVEVQTELLGRATTPAEKRDRIVELALIHEDPGHDDRKAEQVLEGARREFPNDVVVLKALADFYARHKQTPAVNILLDRASADARRAFAAGRFNPALFEIMRAVYDLRGEKEPGRIVGASLLAIEGKPAEVRGAFGPALDPRVDDLLAPDVLSPGLRSLLSRAGSMLDVASPMDLRALGAQSAGPEARMITELASSFTAGLGLETPKIYVSKTVGRTCLPAASDPPSFVVGESLLHATNERAVAFIVMRAMKLVAAHASALVRATSTDLAALVPAWLQAIAPSWAPQGVNPTALAAAAKKVALAQAPQSEELAALAREVAALLGTRASTLGGHAAAWANRAALLGVGDPNAALEALAWSLGSKDGAPADPAARTAWIGRTHEAKDLLIFSVSDAYAEARARLEL